MSVNWLTDRVSDDGRPEGANVTNAWWRAPWALCVAGASDVAAAMVGWVEREALDDNCDFRPGPYAAPSPLNSVYFLSPVAIASWLLGRYDTAELVNSRLRYFQNPETGGVYDYLDFHADPLEDSLKTAQVGVSALLTGDRSTADRVHQWLAVNYAEQPELPRRLFTGRRADKVVTDFPSDQAYVRVVDFQADHQTYFNPGIAAVFLAGYAGTTGSRAAVQLGRDYLSLNKGGTDRQFEDLSSVQICKFGWGAAAMLTADPAGDHRPWVERMATWFCDRQLDDGTWAPSSFATPEPTLLDYYWKTAEHLMELCYIEQALAGAPRV
jgi:hypothetical protein